MSIMDILIRSISGYIFILPVILLYFLKLRKSAKSQSPLHIGTVSVFCYYLIGILTMTGIGKLKSFSPRLVLVPFLDMINGPADTILNIILFLPLGFFLPLLYKKYVHISRVVLTGFFISLSVEIVQMFGRGATDINDLITNTVGACLGYYIYKVFSKLIGQRASEKFYSNRISDSVEVLLFVICSFIIMVTLQPLIISNFFNLG